MNKFVNGQFSVAAVVLCALVLGGCAKLTSVRQHPDFAAHERKITKVAILPPDAEFVYRVFDGDDRRLPEKEKQVVESLSSDMPEFFKERGYEVVAVDWARHSSENPDFAYELQQLRMAFTSASEELYKKAMVSEEEHDDFSVTIGPVVNQFADMAGADALVVVRYAGFEKSQGLVAKEVVGNALLAALSGVYYQPVKIAGAVEVAVLDGNTGDVLWCNAQAGVDTAYGIARMAMLPLPARGLPSPAPAQTQVVKTDDVNAK